MTWNHRIVRKMHHGEPWLGIHEAFYDMDGGVAVTEEPVPVIGESIDELRETLERMLACLDKPVIEDTAEQ